MPGTSVCVLESYKVGFFGHSRLCLVCNAERQLLRSGAESVTMQNRMCQCDCMVVPLLCPVGIGSLGFGSQCCHGFCGLFALSVSGHLLIMTSAQPVGFERGWSARFLTGCQGFNSQAQQKMFSAYVA